MHVEETGPSSVVFTFPSVLPGSQFPATLAADLSFQFEAGTLGVLKGKFRINDVELTVVENGTIDRPPCTFKWTATRRPSAPGN